MIKWIPRKNTEREALRRHPHWWLIRQEGNRLLITCVKEWHMQSDADLRWIHVNQVIREGWQHV